MDWTRIMNKRNKKADEKEAETINKKNVKDETVKEEIGQFFVRLLPEINLHLLLDMEKMAAEFSEVENNHFIFFPSRVLWVEAVTVTACQKAQLSEQSQKPEIVRIWKRLMGTLADIVPLRNI